MGPPHLDHVLVYPKDNNESVIPRLLFEVAAREDGLELTKEEIGKNVFVKVFCPFDRLALEAERVKLEMPLKGLEINPSEPQCCHFLQKRLITDDEVDFVSAPFECNKAHLYEGSEDRDVFFRSSLRSFLVYNILINLDIKHQLRNEAELSNQDDIISKRGLLYLLMKKCYTDSFILHDISADDPYYLRIKEQSLEDYYKQIPKMEEDMRREMNNTWATFWKFQPLWKVRNYFGEKIAFYFAWEGTFITLLWLPALMGLAIFGYGLHLSIKSKTFRNCDNVVSNSEIGLNTTTSTSGLLTTSAMSTSTPTQCSFTSKLSSLGEDILEVVKEAFDNVFTPFFSLIICLWGTLFLEIWKRNNYTLAYQWDVNNYDHAEPDRPEFAGTQQKPDPVTGELSWIYPISKRFRKFFISGLVLSLMVGVVFLSVMGVVAYKVVVRKKFNCTVKEMGDMIDPQYQGSPVFCMLFTTIVPSLLNALSIMLLGLVYNRIAEKLTDWENHRTQSDYNDALIIKLFAFQFANTYTSLFYIAFFRPSEHGFQNNGVFGWGEEYKDTCVKGSCMSLLSFQVLVLMLMKPFPKFFKDVVWPWVKRRYRRIKLRVMRKRNRSSVGAMRQLPKASETGPTSSNGTAGNPSSESGTNGGVESGEGGGGSRVGSGEGGGGSRVGSGEGGGGSRVGSGEGGGGSRVGSGVSTREAVETTVHFVEREFLKPKLGDFTLGEYTEKVIQFGYIVMFAASFPMAPFLALIINLFDLRVDAKRLLWWNRRPVAFIAHDIGMWFPILRFVNFCGVVSNAFIVGYTSSFCDEFFKSYEGQCTTDRRLTIVVIFEHLVFISMYIINVIIPDIPANIALAQRRERYQVTKILEQGEVPVNVLRKETSRDTLPFPQLDEATPGTAETDIHEGPSAGATQGVTEDVVDETINLSNSVRLRSNKAGGSNRKTSTEKEQLIHDSSQESQTDDKSLEMVTSPDKR